MLIGLGKEEAGAAQPARSLEPVGMGSRSSRGVNACRLQAYAYEEAVPSVLRYACRRYVSEEDTRDETNLP